jgi:outer membrane protein OmpA-like peptidoglycan-associated protein
MKSILIFVCLAIAAIEFLGMRACVKAVRPDDQTIYVGPVDNSVVALRDGSAMIAEPGTISRDVIDWFNNETAPRRRFDIGRLAFVPSSAVPAPDTEVRLRRFATELKANPTVRATVQVCTSDNDTADARLAALRANRLKAALVANRVNADRIATQTCQMRGTTKVARQGVQFIGIVLAHGR